MDAIRVLPGFALLLIGFGVAPFALAQGQQAGGGAETTFEKLCYSCHNIGGGDKKGPDLMGLLERRDRAWIHKFVPAPKAMKNAGDPEAVKLFAKYAPEEMPDQVLAADQIDQILDMIQKLTVAKKTFVPKSGRLSRNPTPQDIPAGRALFIGQAKLAAGGPPCIACHSVTGIGRLGGGTLGPDLTNANIRYSTVELASIIKMPAFPMMSKLFANHQLSDEEVVKIFAYLQSVKTLAPDTARSSSGYLLVGAIGVLAMFGLMSFIWKDRLHGVFKPLRKGER